MCLCGIPPGTWKGPERVQGGVSGTLKKRDGTPKDTQAIDSNEYFAKQTTTYVYPLLKSP